jgi:protein-S-isoprenylcysteine O-methyltransferase Ste14
MTNATSVFILCCWIAWLAFWVVSAFSAKRTVERGAWIQYRLVAVLLILGLLLAGHLFHLSSQSRVLQPSTALDVASVCLVLAGLAFTIWARITLGRNWSAEVTFKEDHHLIQSGPYALARHPIYTGLIAMALGTAINYGRVIGLVVFVGACGGLWWKAREEERMMASHFPDTYPEYKTRVRAIVPFVL